LGKHKSKASRDEYERVIAEFLANGKKLPPTRGKGEGIAIEELAIRFLEHAESYYQKNGEQTSTLYLCKLALSPLVQHYGSRSVYDFGPLSLVFLRDQWVKAGTARQTINSWVNIIRQAFRWGVAHELVASDILHALEAVDHLKAGRTPAPEYQEIEPVSDEIVEKTLPHLPPIIADMVRVQRLVGMRPQDIRNMRYCDIDRTGDVWKYAPVHS
jgi:integrase